MLTADQNAFCRAYVRFKRNGADAWLANHPGATRDAARVSASRMLKVPGVREEIERISREEGAVVVVGPGGGGKGGQPPLHGTAYGPDEPLPSSPPEAVNLTRPWIVETLIRNARMCMGDEDVPVSKMVKRTIQDDKGAIREEIIAQTVFVRERDAAAANTALKLLSDQLELMKAEAAGTAKPGAHQISEAAQLQLDRIAAAMGPRHEPAANAA